MRGGIKVYRGSASAARTYVEADRSRADDYYLVEGGGLADRYVATREGIRREPALDGDGYEAWVAGFDVDTGEAKGRLRSGEQAVRFLEVVVNGPKSWSLAAALHPEVAAAYDAAQERAATEIIGWLAAHATTRVGPRGRQVQVPVEEIEAAVVRHYTSRAGDPHWHLHLQVNARVWAAGAWRGLHTVGVRDSLEAINGIGHAAVMCDPTFRTALARHGYRLDQDGEVLELKPYVGGFSARTAQIGRNVERYEAQWRAEHPDREPGPRLRQSWDRRAWAEARPDKVVPRDGDQITRRWIHELHDLGFRPPVLDVPLRPTPIGGLDRDAVVETVLVRLGARRSAWNTADIRGEVEQAIAAGGVVADPQVRAELTEDLTSRTLDNCLALLTRDDVPEHIRALTSPQVLAVEDDLTTRLTNRAEAPIADGHVRPRTLAGLDATQRRVVEALAGEFQLLVIEGAAGAGKTTTLSAASHNFLGRGAGFVVVTPTLKAAQVAAEQLKAADAFSAAHLVHAHGFRWDADGRWTRVDQQPRTRDPEYLWRGSILLVDEAGMLDQDTARALLTIAEENKAKLVLMGDRQQLPAIGRGGVLDLATRLVSPEAHHTLETIHRFADPDYADLSLLMRTGERSDEVFDALVSRGEIVVHPSEVERTAALATVDGLVIADTREQVATLNAAIRDHRLTTTEATRDDAVTTAAGEQIGVGDRVATRRNNRDLGVANRDTWTVVDIGSDSGLQLRGRNGERLLPNRYVREYLELAYATTAYGAQGETVDEAHLALGDKTGAASAYVAMTRGRHRNTAHLVADSTDEARKQWVDVFTRDRADLGVEVAASRAAAAIDLYGPRSHQHVDPPLEGYQPRSHPDRSISR